MPSNTTEYMNNYYKNNKEKFREYNSFKLKCVFCGKETIRQNISNHQKTKNCFNNRDKYKYSIFLNALQKLDIQPNDEKPNENPDVEQPDENKEIIPN